MGVRKMFEYAELSGSVHFSDWKYPLWANLKNQNCQFKLQFGVLTNSNMLNSMVVFTFAVLDQKYPFWANLVQKI